MPAESISIRCSCDGEREFRQLQHEFGQAANGQVQQKLRQHLYQTAMPVLNDLRAAVMAVRVMSSQGGAGSPPHTTHLRKRIAAALRVTVAYSGVRFGASESAIGPQGAALAKYLDAELPGYQNWRHPVFGGPAWTVQKGSNWFGKTIRDHESDFEQACYRAISDVLRDIAH